MYTDMMQVDEAEDIFNDEDTPINQDTLRYLQHIENKLYQDIEARKRIDSALLFLCCQIGASSLSWLLFSLQVSISLIAATSMIFSLLPGLIDAGDGFNFELNSENWGIKLPKPLIALTKLGIGGIFGWNSTRRITQDVYQTRAAIQATYTQIKNADARDSSSWSIDPAFVIAGLVGILIIYFSNQIRGNKENQNVPKE